MSSNKLGIRLNIDQEQYKVVIQKTDLGDDNRLYYICYKRQWEDSCDMVMTYFSKLDSDKVEIWEQEAVSYEKNILKTEKIDDGNDIELIIEEGEPRKVTMRYLIPCSLKRKSDLLIIE
jgi:hypothetical protein